MFEKITEAEINERSMANVSTTPNRPTAFGESKMDAQALKLRFDRLSRYLAGRINEIFAGMSDGNLAKNVKIVEEKGEETIEYSLAEFILKMIEGDLTQINVKVPEGTQRLDVICNQVLRWQNEIKTGDFADETVVVTGVTIRQFYEEFKKLEETGQGKPGEPGKSAYDYAVEGGYQGTEEEFAKKLATDYPSKVSQLENDEKYITASGAPVQNVNGKAGNVSLSATDVGARPNTWTPTAYDVGAEPVNTVSTHNASDQAHNDIRIELRNLANKINDLLDSDDENLNELHEIVEYIKNNHTLISNITTSKVSVADIVNDLVTSLPNKPLSAAQGVALKALIDAITVPTKLSQLENDKGYITGYTESDPTVPEWAKAASKPSYTKSEVGLANVDNVKQYSASNPPPYPVKSVNNKTGNVNLAAEDVGARPNTWTPTAADVGAEKSGNVAAHNTNTAAHNDIRLLIEGLSNRINAIFDSEDTDLDELSEIVAYIKSNKDLIDAITTSKVSISDIIDNLETSDSKKPLSAKQGVVLKALIDAITIPTKLSELENDKKFITKSEAPVQTVNKKTGNVELNAEDVGARPNTWMPTASEVGARPDDWMPTAADVGARPDDWMPTASDVGARPATWMPSYSDVGAEKAGNVNTHNTNGAAHNDIRVLIASLSERINAVLDSDDTTLDELSEIVTYIKANKTLIESVTTSKVNVSDIIDNLETPDPTKPLSAKQGAYIMGVLQQLLTEFGKALDTKADKERGVFFIKGEGTTAGTWLGGCSGIDSYYDGLMIAYKIGVAGASTTTLNINSLGAVKVVKNNNTGISTSFAVNSVIFLVYTVDGSTAYWKAHDYDANTRNSVGDYQKNNTKLYFVGTTTTDSETSSSYATSYTNSKVYVDENNVFNAESGLKGNLTGNADTATKATQDGNGNNIPNTYETKANATAKYSELADRIGEGAPVRGEDYWTPSDRQEILEEASEFIADEIAKREQKKVETAMSQAWLKENGDPEQIYLLIDDTDPLNGYFFAYKQGETVEVENAVSTSIDKDGSIYNGVGYKNNTYLSENAWNACSQGASATGFIPYARKADKTYPTIYVKGLAWNTTKSHSRLFFSTKTFSTHYGNTTGKTSFDIQGTNNYLTTNFTIEKKVGDAWVATTAADTGTYWRLIPNATFSAEANTSHGGENVITYMRMSLIGDGANLIISIDTPIETTAASSWQSTGLYLVDDGNSTQILENKKNISNLKARVSILEAGGVNTEVESYVLEEAEEVADKVLGVRNANSFVMALASDLHTDGKDDSSVSVIHAGQGMDAINSMTQLDLVALLGDYEIWDFDDGIDADGKDKEDASKSFKHAKRAFSSVAKGVPLMMLQGNHDKYAGDSPTVARRKYYAYIGANNVGTVTDYANKFRNYGYRDFDNYKIRVIYLNTADASDNPSGTDCKVSSEQLNWLNTVALNLNDPEWVIAALSHHPSDWDGLSNLMNALDAHNGKSGVAKVIAHFHGHLHNYRVKALGTTGIQTIAIPNAGGLGRENEYGTYEGYTEDFRKQYGDIVNGVQQQHLKTLHSREDTSFNVVVIDRDPENRKIYCFNYGAGRDREISY